MAAEQFQQLTDLMARLRGPGGCPWDREQTFDTLRSYLLEETYEVLDALERRDWQELAAELGDLQLQIVFLSQVAAEQGLFTIQEVLGQICHKLVRRHPHVFAGEPATSAGQALKRWNEVKAGETGPGPLLDGVRRSIPALMEAFQLSSRASQAGFDWQRFEDMLDKLQEEIRELRQAREGSGNREAVEEEVGDLLFMLVNMARFLHVDPEPALRRTNRKFRERFAQVERGLAERGRSLAEAGLEEMEELWQRAKNG